MFIGVCTDTYVFYQSILEKKTYFGHCESLNFQMAPRASILNQFSQIRMHFKVRISSFQPCIICKDP